MTKEERVKKQKELIEELGIYFDKEGFQPIAGRIMGLLTVMDKEQYTFEEIVEELQISKSSASTALKNLEIRGAIEYVTFPGDRKRYFRIHKQDKFARIEEFEKRLRHMLTMSERIIELKEDKNSRNSLILKEMQGMFKIHINYLQKLLKEYKSE